MENNSIPIVLIILGATIMVYNIYKYFVLTRQLSSLHTSTKKFPKVILLIYIILLIFFLIGYLVVGIGMGFPSGIVSNMLVGLIFFFGSVFVLIGFIMLLSMSSTIRESSLEITQALITAVEARDTNLNGHSMHVARLTVLLYHHLSKEQQRTINLEDLEYAALLHDIGKLGVSEDVLNKEGALSAEEWLQIKKHPQIGKNILSRINCFKEISDWVLYHHERCDGKGYLLLSKDQIPFPSLMIAIADTYSAITMKRSYRNAKSHAEAIEILKGIRETQLDKELVDIFIEIPTEQIQACMLVEYELNETALLLH